MALRKVQLSLRDRFGNILDFADSGQLRVFVDAELDAWSWLDSAKHERVNMADHLLGRLRSMPGWFDTFEAGGWDDNTLLTQLDSSFVNNGAGLFSDKWPGSAIIAVARQFGPDLAERALEIISGLRTADVGQVLDLRAICLVSVPASIAPEAQAEETFARLAHARTQLQHEIANYQAVAARVVTEASAKNDRLVRKYRNLARLSIGAAKRRAGRVSKEARESIDEIDATRKAYAVEMQLKAPVSYWQIKGTKHATGARNWGIALVVYVVLAIFFACLLFPHAWAALAQEGPLNGRHILLVAAVGSGLTVLFWGARMLSRLYLGERHLKTDAEERQVMTQAYLALIKEKAASDQERALILAALFRNAQDGVVRDTGGVDLSLSAIAAKLMEPKATHGVG